MDILSMIPMIATKTATLMVAMAVMGIVPVAAHAQSVDIDEIAAIATDQEARNDASSEQNQVNVDEDRNTSTNAAFGTVGANGEFTSTQDNEINDEDSLSNSQQGTTQATSSQTSTSTVEATQQPTLTAAEVLALL
jgi:hypothetical protein